MISVTDLLVYVIALGLAAGLPRLHRTAAVAMADVALSIVSREF